MCEQDLQNGWYHHQFYAMGCQMSAWLEVEDESTATQALRQVEALFGAAEKRLTRFAATSELAQLNAHAGGWWPVSNVLWAVVTQALALAKQTDGRFDPTLLTALTAAGYDRSFDLVRVGTTIQRSTSLNGAPRTMPVQSFGQWQQIQLDAAHHTIHLPAGVQLDLGGIGKGYTAQQAVNFLSQWGPALVDAGGDLVAGDAPTASPGWPVAIAAPAVDGDTDDSPRDLAQLWLKNAALATSGTDYRRWLHNGQPAHHLIDPKTGCPAQSDLLTVSVLAADGSTAEAWAKALLFAGAAGAQQETIEKQIAAALVDHDRQLMLSPTLEPFVAVRFDQS